MPDHSSSTPTDRVSSRRASPLVRWLRASLPVLRPKADQEGPDRDRIRTTGWRVQKGMDRVATDDPANPYVHYREVKEALRRANLDFAAAVGANASSRVQERMARRVSRLQVKEDQAVLAMRRQDRSWSGRGFVGVFHHSDGSAG
jgi:hypothetical protein